MAAVLFRHKSDVVFSLPNKSFSSQVFSKAFVNGSLTTTDCLCTYVPVFRFVLHSRCELQLNNPWRCIKCVSREPVVIRYGDVADVHREYYLAISAPGTV